MHAQRWSPLQRLFVIFIILLLVYTFMKKDSNVTVINNNPNKILDSPDFASNLTYFATARGKIHIDEIIENVFDKNGYIFIKNDLIPILEKETPMTCDEVFSEWQKIADNGLTLDPPKELPNSETFLLNNYSKLKSWYVNSVPHNEDSSIPVWDEKFVENWINIVKKDPFKLKRPYKIQSMAVYMATKYFDISGKIGAVIGSLTPWVETYLLVNGAKNVTTVDYQKYKITHPQMNFIYAPDLPSIHKSLQNYYDFIVSYSSVEHSGLGRYGDPMDPIGDIREMNKIHCLLKNKGLLFVGFPVGEDSIYYNAHRIYGRMRLAMMFEGFQLLEVFFLDSSLPIKLTQEILEMEGGINQYLFVLKKIG